MRAYPRRGRPTVRSRMFVAVLGSLIAIGGWTSAATASSTVYLDVGGTANALAFEPTGEHAYVAAAGGLVVLDAASRSIEATVPLGGSSESIAVDPVSGHVLAVTGADLTIIDPDTASVAGTIHLSLPPGYSSNFIVRARKIAMSAALSRAFVIIQVGRPPGPGTPPPAWHLVSVDVTGGPANQISTAALGSLGDSRPTGIVVDDVSGHVYVGKAGTGILSFDAGTLASLGTINGTSNLIFDSALALDSANHRLYAGLQTAGAAIAIIDTTNDTVIGSLPATGSRSVAVDPVRGRVLVPDIGALQVFEGGALAQSVPFNWLPNLAVVDPATGDAWVTLNSGGIAVVDLAPGGTPRSGFVTSAGGDLYRRRPALSLHRSQLLQREQRRMVSRRGRRRDPRRVARRDQPVVQRPRGDPGLVLPDARGQRAVGCPGLDALRPAPARGREPWLQGHPDARRSVGRVRCPGQPHLRVQDRGLVHRRLCGAGSGPRRGPRRHVAELPGLGRRGRRPLQGRRDRRVLAADERGGGQPRRRVRRLPAGRRATRRARSTSPPTCPDW